MGNPFLGKSSIDKQSEWIGNRKVFEELESCIDQRVNTVILGPEGCGKTSLVKCFFTWKFREAKALDEKSPLLICQADLSGRKDGEDICNYLVDILKICLDDLLGDDEEKWKEINKRIERIERTSDSAKTRLEGIINLLKDRFGYFVVLVMDCFERFTSSSEIGPEHHDILRALIEAEKLQCIVATDYDLSQDSLPENVKGSFFLQKFTKQILIPAFSKEDAITFVQKKQEKSSLKLSDDVIAALYKLSGGNPLLLEFAAECAYENMESNNGSIDVKGVKEAVYQKCKPIMRSWCKLLTEAQVEVLKKLAGHINENKKLACYDFTGESEEIRGAVASLKSRGIVMQASRTDEFGNVIRMAENCVSFNSLLFQKFCKEGDMEKSVKGISSSDKEVKEAPAPSSIVYNFYGDSKANFSGAQDYSQTTRMENVQIETVQMIQGITLSQLMSNLENPEVVRRLFSQQLQSISECGLSYLGQEENIGEEAFAQQCDVKYDEVGRHIIQDIEVDEEQNLVNVTSDELQTLDTRFDDARKRHRTNITDEILGAQSKRCQFYIKLSVVVEDALDFSEVFTVGDFSPQLVLYGKVLEQALRDNLYELFHKEAKLSIYSTYTHSENISDKNVFKNMMTDQTYIGNYEFLIRDKVTYLEELCKSHHEFTSEFNSSTQWGKWWKQLRSDINTARKIRNFTDHADERSPEKGELDSMCSLLFGTDNRDGILKRILIGKTLSEQLFSEKQCI